MDTKTKALIVTWLTIIVAMAAAVLEVLKP